MLNYVGLFIVYGWLAMISVLLLVMFGRFVLRWLPKTRQDFENGRQKFPAVGYHLRSCCCYDCEKRKARKRAEEEIEKLTPQRDFLWRRIQRLKEKKNSSGNATNRILRNEVLLGAVSKKIAAQEKLIIENSP